MKTKNISSYVDIYNELCMKKTDGYYKYPGTDMSGYLMNME